MEVNRGENLPQKVTAEAEESVEQLDSLAKKARKKNKRHKRKIGFYYSFLTIVLLFCLVQVGFGAILNISKIISYKAKINTMEKVRDAAELRNKELKTDIKQFSRTSSLEEIARNNLKMAGEDEVLVIINNNNQETAEVKDKHKKEQRSNNAE